MARVYGHQRCKKCIYRGPEIGENGCDYLYFTGKSRRCPLGDKCTEFKAGQRLRKEAEMPEDGRSAEERAVDWYRGRGYTQDRTKF